MANITKKVTRHIGANQTWDTSVDLNDDGDPIADGDIFRIETSLGKPGKNLSITTGSGELNIRINPIVNHYPTRSSQEFFNANIYKNLAEKAEIIDESQSPITIPATETWEFNGEIAIRTIQIVSMDANFTVIIN